MQILFLAWENTAGIPYTLVRALNAYTPHTATLIQANDNWIKYPTGILESQISDSAFQKKVAEADVIHLDVMCPETKLRRDFTSSGKKLTFKQLAGKKVVRHAHGSVTRRTPALGSITKAHNISNIVSTPDLLKNLPQATWLPNPLYLEDPHYTFRMPRMTKTINICHSPTNRVTKSSNLFEAAIKNINSRLPYVAYAPINRLPFGRCMALKRRCHAIYDQFTLGAYGVSPLEMMAVGGLAFAGVQPMAQHYSKLRGPLPVVDVNAGSLESTLEYWLEMFKTNPSVVRQRILAGRKWVEDNHSAKVVVQQLLDVYDKTNLCC